MNIGGAVAKIAILLLGPAKKYLSRKNTKSLVLRDIRYIQESILTMSPMPLREALDAVINRMADFQNKWDEPLFDGDMEAQLARQKSKIVKIERMQVKPKYGLGSLVYSKYKKEVHTTKYILSKFK